jgi:DNA-binding NarL/FixJ family response regulator
MIFEQEKIEGLIAQCRFAEAIAALTVEQADRRTRAGVCAIAGDEPGVARAIDPALLACRNATDVAAHYAAAGIEPGTYDRLAAAVVLAWASDAAGAYATLRAAYDEAFEQRRFHLAVSARERLARHALFFGDLGLAREAIGEAITAAELHGLSRWLLRCTATAARLALEAGDHDAAAARIARGRASAGTPDEIALFAGVGAQLAAELGEGDALAAWTSSEIVDVALRSESLDVVNAATVATLIGAGTSEPDGRLRQAVRRALAQTGPAGAPVLFTTAARYADLEDAQFAVDASAAVFAPNRPYLRAHRLLARAHVLVRTGDRAESIDCAGDAARAFSTMGLRRWTNEAMRLLVSQDASAERRPRARPSSTLTEREEQVAHLIRRGARNREVAMALQISEHTVERHVSSILGRLGLRSRWQIADPRRSEER